MAKRAYRRHPDAARPPGQAPHEPTSANRLLVATLHSHGINHRIISKVLGITEPTLRAHYPDELIGGKDTTKAWMVAKLIECGLGGNVNAIKYWLICHGGPEWKPVEGRLLTGDPNAPVYTKNVNELTEDEITERLADLDKREQALAEARAMDSTMPKRSNGVGH